MSHKIFISHGWADRWVASQIERRLVELGAQTFIDMMVIEKGDDIEERIFSELPTCEELIALFTPWSVDRNWVWVEIGAARALGKRVVAVLYQVDLALLEREKGGSTFLRAKNAVDINELESYFLEVARRLKKASG